MFTDDYLKSDREKLMDAFERGYFYITKDEESRFYYCFSLKPKRYMDDKKWGYPERHWGSDRALPAIALEVQLDNVKWSNRQPTLIADILEKEGEVG